MVKSVLTMPNSIHFINHLFHPRKSNKMKHPNNWLLIILLALLLACMLGLVKHYNTVEDLQQKIYDHSEIKDTI